MATPVIEGVAAKRTNGQKIPTEKILPPPFVVHLSIFQMILFMIESARPHMFKRLWKRRKYAGILELRFLFWRIGYLVTDGPSIYTIEQNLRRGTLQAAALSDLLGTNAIIALDKGPKHTALARMMLKPFNHEALSEYLQVIYDLIEATLDEWAAEKDINVLNKTSELTKKMIFQTVFKDTSISQADQDLFLLALNLFMQKFILLAIVPKRFHRLIPGYAKYKWAKELTYETLDRVLDERRAQNWGNDILGVMLQEFEAENMSRQEMKENLLTMFLAAQTTLADTLAWAFYYLATEPKVTTVVTAEANSLSEEPVTFSLLGRLKQIVNFVNEVLRHKGPSWWAFGITEEEGFQVGGYQLAGKSITFLITLLSHTNPTYWGDDAEKFNINRVWPSWFIPFGTGAHTCIGKRLAEVVLQIFVYCVTRRFTLAVDRKYKSVFQTAQKAPEKMKGTVTAR